MPDATLRIDKFLWFTRLARSRSVAQALAEAGHLRIDGRRIERAHCPVKVGAVLSFPCAAGVRVIRVEALPARRGPARDARACYFEIVDEPRAGSLAASVEGAHAP